MYTAGVVADHTAKRAATMGGGVGAERQMVLLGRIAEHVEHGTWLHPRTSVRRVDFDHPVHIFAEVDHDCDIAALAGEAGAASAREDRRPKLPCSSDGCAHILL